MLRLSKSVVFVNLSLKEKIVLVGFFLFVLSCLTEPKNPQHLSIPDVPPAAHSCIIKAMVM